MGGSCWRWARLAKRSRFVQLRGPAAEGARELRWGRGRWGSLSDHISDVWGPRPERHVQANGGGRKEPAESRFELRAHSGVWLPQRGFTKAGSGACDDRAYGSSLD